MTEGEYKFTFYEGSNYGLDPNHGEFLQTNYRIPLSEIGLAVDPRTANQLSQTSHRLATGAKAAEVQLSMPEVAESIPNQHLDELNKLRKLIGVDLTVHGALVEPTGVSKQGWEETHRQQAEKQLFSSLERAHRVNPEGNVVVTFHSSNGLPEPVTKVIDEKTGEEKIENVWAVDERDGQFAPVSPKVDYFEGEKKVIDPYKQMKLQNKDQWEKSLHHITFNANNGHQIVSRAMLLKDEDEGISEETLNRIKKVIGNKPVEKFYKEFMEGDGAKLIEETAKKDEFVAQKMNHAISRITHGDIHVRESYGELQKHFNKVYENALIKEGKNSETIKKLDAYRDRVGKTLNEIKDDPARIVDLAQEVVKGVNVLRQLDTPQYLTPLRDFAVDKSSTTFSNMAFKAYDKFGKTSPVISIENPPAGMGLSRAQDIKDIVVKSREKFEKQLIDNKGLSRSEAKKQAEKLIGATWDLGHINMIKKYGYDDDALIKETKTIKPFVKNIHLSDNFGMEHTELPMGMGNVPTKRHMDILEAYNKKVKKIVETGNWYQHFQVTPFKETLEAFGSPIYAMSMGPYWNQQADTFGGYFGGQGMINPQIHHSIYGSGFSNLPTELGGSAQQQGSRVSGNPME
jgi:sugar phosphate isomerase/epimerase/molybdopterin converting factor small subunit